MIHVGMLLFDYGRSDKNFHGTQKKGERRNEQTVKGPKFLVVNIERKSPGFSKRFIFYWPSGAWWHLDIYSKRRVVKIKKK
jgi:hypothetical protein